MNQPEHTDITPDDVELRTDEVPAPSDPAAFERDETVDGTESAGDGGAG